MSNYRIETKCVQGGYTPGNGEPRQIPIVQSTTFKYSTSEDMGKLFDLEAEGYFYSRLQNPTCDLVAAKICELEGGSAAMLTSSGQAANFYAVFNIANCGDHVVSSSTIYGGTFNLFAVTMKKMGIDVLCFTGHKGLMGPQGTGGICVKEGIEIRPFKVGGSGVQSYSRTHPAEYPTRLEAGTLNGHGIAGLGAAAKFISETGVENIHAKERSLMLRFYEGVKNIEGVTVYGDFTKDKTAIVALNIRDYESGEVSYELSQGYGIATRPGAHCAPRMHKALGTAEVGAVRFSFSFYNTEEEIDEAVRAVAELAK